MKGMVVTPQPLASEEGVIALRNGGNAVDAAVTTALVQAVIDPLNCGIGGLGWMNIHLEHGEDVYLDFSAKAGTGATPDIWVKEILYPAADGGGFILRGDVNEIGYRSIGVPGTIKGLHEALVRYGTRTWEETVGPAVEIARAGYPIPFELAQEWRKKYTKGRPDALRRFTCTPEAARIYTKKGEVLDSGDILVNSHLAGSLKKIGREGPDTFYQGEMAERISLDLAANNAFVTREDLANYEVEVTAPLRLTYRGYTVTSAPPPAGGMTLLGILKILEGYDLKSLGFNTAEYIQVVSQALKAGFADRNRYLGDPAFVDIPGERLLSESHAEEWRDRIDRGEKFDVGFDRSRDGGTTQVSIVDDVGNCVSLTHTCGLCSGVVTPGLGFLYNNFMFAFDPVPGGPNSIAPGKKRVTGSCPAILYKNGVPFMVLGAPGGTRIISAVLQTILNVVDHGMTATEAVSAPRFDCQGDTVEVEGRIPRWVCEHLEGLGLSVKRDLASYGIYASTAARVHAILIDPETGKMSGGADPRGYGNALSV